jgi:hypothetical protein
MRALISTRPDSVDMRIFVHTTLKRLPKRDHADFMRLLGTTLPFHDSRNFPLFDNCSAALPEGHQCQLWSSLVKDALSAERRPASVLLMWVKKARCYEGQLSMPLLCELIDSSEQIERPARIWKQVFQASAHLQRYQRGWLLRLILDAFEVSSGDQSLDDFHEACLDLAKWISSLEKARHDDPHSILVSHDALFSRLERVVDQWSREDAQLGIYINQEIGIIRQASNSKRKEKKKSKSKPENCSLQ